MLSKMMLALERLSSMPTTVKYKASTLYIFYVFKYAQVYSIYSFFDQQKRKSGPTQV